MLSASANDTLAMKLLIQKDALVDATTKGGYTPLSYALQSSHIIKKETVTALLEAGSDPLFLDPESYSAIQWCVAGHPRHKNQPEALAAILKSLHDENLIQTDEVQKVLFETLAWSLLNPSKASDADIAPLVWSLVKNGADPHQLQKGLRKSPMEYASSRKLTLCVEAMEKHAAKSPSNAARFADMNPRPVKRDKKEHEGGSSSNGVKRKSQASRCADDEPSAPPIKRPKKENNVSSSSGKGPTPPPVETVKKSKKRKESCSDSKKEVAAEGDDGGEKEHILPEVTPAQRAAIKAGKRKAESTPDPSTSTGGAPKRPKTTPVIDRNTCKESEPCSRKNAIKSAQVAKDTKALTTVRQSARQLKFLEEERRRLEEERLRAEAQALESEGRYLAKNIPPPGTHEYARFLERFAIWEDKVARRYMPELEVGDDLAVLPPAPDYTGTDEYALYLKYMAEAADRDAGPPAREEVSEEEERLLIEKVKQAEKLLQMQKVKKLKPKELKLRAAKILSISEIRDMIQKSIEEFAASDAGNGGGGDSSADTDTSAVRSTHTTHTRAMSATQLSASVVSTIHPASSSGGTTRGSSSSGCSLTIVNVPAPSSVVVNNITSAAPVMATEQTASSARGRTRSVTNSSGNSTASATGTTTDDITHVLTLDTVASASRGTASALSESHAGGSMADLGGIGVSTDTVGALLLETAAGDGIIRQTREPPSGDARGSSSVDGTLVQLDVSGDEKAAEGFPSADMQGSAFGDGSDNGDEENTEDEDSESVEGESPVADDTAGGNRRDRITGAGRHRSRKSKD